MSDQSVTALLAVSDGLFFIFDETGELRDWNQAVVERTPVDPDAVSTMTPECLLADDASADLAAAATELAADESTTVETVVVTADGERRHYAFTLHQLTDDGTPTYGAIGRDITKRKRAERQREAIVDRMSDGMFALDTDWHVTYANEFGAEILADAIGRELPPEEIEGTHLWEAIPEAVDTVFYEKYHEAVDSQEPVSFEAPYEPLDIWFDVRAYPSETGLSVYLYDITDRRRQREAAERRERVLREMYEIIADGEQPFREQVTALLELGRTELDTRYGTLSRIVGEEYHFEIVVGDDDSIQSGDVGELSATNCELVASREETVVLGDVERDAPEQTDRAGFTDWGICCYVGAPVYLERRVYGTFCFYGTEPRDEPFSRWEQTLVDLMSRWVSYELQRQRATEQLEARTEQLEAKNEQLEQFAEVISHDLRNPLGVLDGWLETAAETGNEDAFDRCFNAIDRMNTLVDEILTLARAGSVIDDPEPLDIAAVARAAWETVDTPTSTLVVDTEQTIRADETRLQQLFENLFRNAVEHATDTQNADDESDDDNGGTDDDNDGTDDSDVDDNDSDTSGTDDTGVTVTLGALPDGFYVEDDGPGIPPDERDDVLESGYSTSDDGTGFGLAIVAEVADAHGWELTVTEGTDGGARFACTEVS